MQTTEGRPDDEGEEVDKNGTRGEGKKIQFLEGELKTETDETADGFSRGKPKNTRTREKRSKICFGLLLYFYWTDSLDVFN